MLTIKANDSYAITQLNQKNWLRETEKKMKCANLLPKFTVLPYLNSELLGSKLYPHISDRSTYLTV